MLKLKKAILLLIFTVSVIFIKQNVYASERVIPNLDNKTDENTNLSNKIYGHLKITVLDDTSIPIENVTFHILDENKEIVTIMTTDENGFAISKVLDGGTYYYREASVPLEVIPDTYEYPFRISERNQTITKKVINNLLKKRLILYTLTSGYSPVENAKYNILDANGFIVDTISTDYTGIAISKELDVGKYYYSEVSIPNGIVNDDTKHVFNINDVNDNCEKRTLIKRYASGNLKLTCIDENSFGVMGVTFNILDSSKNILDTITTDITGTAYSKKLNVGNYYYQAVSGPTNIILDTRETEFLINKNNELVSEKIFIQLMDIKI